MPRRFGQRGTPSTPAPDNPLDLTAPIALSDIGAAVRQMRLERGWTIREVDRRTGISDAYLSQLECGTRRGSQEVLESLFAAFGCEIKAVIINRKEADPA